MIKKIIQMVMVLLFTIPVITHAQTVTIGNAANQFPGSVSFNIDMTGFPPDLGAVTLMIEYDDDLLDYTGYSSPFGQVIINPNYLGEPHLKLTWWSQNGTTINGTFITLDFDYYGGFSNTLAFVESECEITDVPGTPITGITYVNGTITPDLSDPDGIATIDDVVAIAGGVASVPLKITDAGGFDDVAATMTLRIGYDTDKLVYNGISDNSLGFNAGENNGIITLDYFNTSPLNFPLTDPVLNLNFQYLGGVAEVAFLSGSIVTDDEGNILVTQFQDGQVDLNVPPGSGTLSIERKTAEPGEVEVEISASDLSGTPAGVLEMKIAYDNEKLDYDGFSSGSFPSGWTSSQSPGYITFSLTNPSGFTINDGEVLTLEFEYFGDLANITFEPGTLLKDTDSDPIPVGLSNGWVTPPLVVNTKVYLQGPWNTLTNEMNTDLLDNGYIPNIDPYLGIENVPIPVDVVDWILIELRTSATSAAVGQRAGFLLNDGSVVDLDGSSLLGFGDGLVAGDYYIVVKHRNHLAIMSADAQPLNSASALYDFTTNLISGDNPAYKVTGLTNTDPQKNIGGVWCMISGDATANGEIQLSDYFIFSNDFNKTGYFSADWNMDTEVKLSDYFIFVPNFNFKTHVPN